MRVIQLLAFTSTVCLTQGFSIGTSSSTSSTQLNAVAQTRSQFFNTLSVAAATAATTTLAPFVANAEEVVTLPSGTTYEVLKAGEGPAPTVGELAAIRFKAEVKQSGQKIDDIFDSPEPYYTRVGSGGLLKGVEEVLPKMRVGDRFLITVPNSMAFGPKGRPSSAGKPRIPNDAIVTFEVQMEGLPGREEELINIMGDE